MRFAMSSRHTNTKSDCVERNKLERSDSTHIGTPSAQHELSDMRDYRSKVRRSVIALAPFLPMTALDQL